MTRDELLRRVGRALRAAFGDDEGDLLQRELERRMPTALPSCKAVLHLPPRATEGDAAKSIAALEKFLKAPAGEFLVLPHGHTLEWVELPRLEWVELPRAPEHAKAWEDESHRPVELACPSCGHGSHYGTCRRDNCGCLRTESPFR